MSEESKLLDRVRYVILKAPNRFPSDTGMTLEKAFNEMELFVGKLNLGPEFIDSLNKALWSYQNGEQKLAISALQEIEAKLAKR
ncbi:hypothetical protein [Neptuniibacter sp. QD48_11]|uniref:hypothetical protein n=1 Tax=unclassified Neptuniibacter TaxID=2630693 RepID=UPI0039F60479